MKRATLPRFALRPTGLLLGLLGATACNQADPIVGESTDTTAGGTFEHRDGYYPLVDGARWTYRHVDPDQSTWDEVVEMTYVPLPSGPAFEAADNAGLNGTRSVATLVLEDDKVLRVHKEVFEQDLLSETVDYDPGFLRFDESWTAGETTNWRYDRVERDADGLARDASVRQQRFIVESMSVSVTVPAGTFDCIQFLRERDETGEARRFWFAPGVGKVKHVTVDTGSEEQLVEWSIP
jgi:hypothetical protein